MQTFTVICNFFRFIFRVKASNEAEVIEKVNKITTGKIDKIIKGDVYNDYKIVDNKVTKK